MVVKGNVTTNSVKLTRSHYMSHVGLLPLSGLSVSLKDLKSFKSKISLYNNTI